MTQKVIDSNASIFFPQTFVIVRPPPTSGPKKLLNLQIQLVLDVEREKKRSKSRVSFILEPDSALCDVEADYLSLIWIEHFRIFYRDRDRIFGSPTRCAVDIDPEQSNGRLTAGSRPSRFDLFDSRA